jgi:hypothetical protein
MAEFDYGRNMATPSDSTDMSQAKLGKKMGRKAATPPEGSRAGSGRRMPYDGSGTPGSATSNVGQGAKPYRK